MQFQINEQDIIQTAKKEAEENIKKRMIESSKTKINILFMDKETRKAAAAWSAFRDQDLSSAGFCFDQINSVIEDHALSSDYKAIVEKYIANNFQRHLEEALEKAMKHQANKIAFSKESMEKINQNLGK